jgi:hypothetical protein
MVDPQDVEFVIKDLLKGRHIGVYQDLTPGGEQFLSRSKAPQVLLQPLDTKIVSIHLRKGVRILSFYDSL